MEFESEKQMHLRLIVHEARHRVRVEAVTLQLVIITLLSKNSVGSDSSLLYDGNSIAAKVEFMASYKNKFLKLEPAFILAGKGGIGSEMEMRK